MEKIVFALKTFNESFIREILVNIFSKIWNKSLSYAEVESSALSVHVFFKM